MQTLAGCRRDVKLTRDRAGGRLRRQPQLAAAGVLAPMLASSRCERRDAMAGIYFLALAAAGRCWLLRRPLAGRGLAADAGAGALHSLPIYHGLFVAAASVVPMLLVFVDRRAAGRAISRTRNALDCFAPDVAADELQRGVAAARHP